MVYILQRRALYFLSVFPCPSYFSMFSLTDEWPVQYHFHSVMINCANPDPGHDEAEWGPPRDWETGSSRVWPWRWWTGETTGRGWSRDWAGESGHCCCCISFSFMFSCENCQRSIHWWDFFICVPSPTSIFFYIFFYNALDLTTSWDGRGWRGDSASWMMTIVEYFNPQERLAISTLFIDLFTDVRDFLSGGVGCGEGGLFCCYGQSGIRWLFSISMPWLIPSAFVSDCPKW